MLQYHYAEERKLRGGEGKTKPKQTQFKRKKKNVKRIRRTPETPTSTPAETGRLKAQQWDLETQYKPFPAKVWLCGLCLFTYGEPQMTGELPARLQSYEWQDLRTDKQTTVQPHQRHKELALHLPSHSAYL